MGYFDDDPEFHKRKKRCSICGAGFHWERGYTVHMSFHEHGVIGNDGHQTNEQKIKQIRGRQHTYRKSALKPWQFFHLYAGLPLHRRFWRFPFPEGKRMMISEIHKRISEIQAQQYKLHSEEEMLLKATEEYLITYSTSKL